MINLDCLFCNIGAGIIPSYKVYEDDIVIAFLDIHPNSNGHTLIVPKKHYESFMDLDSNTLLHINMVAKNIVNLLEEKLGATGFHIATNYLDMQDIKHYHLHVIPRNNGKIKSVEEIYSQIKN